jgi:phage-related holin
VLKSSNTAGGSSTIISKKSSTTAITKKKKISVRVPKQVSRRVDQALSTAAVMDKSSQGIIFYIFYTMISIN